MRTFVIILLSVISFFAHLILSPLLAIFGAKIDFIMLNLVGLGIFYKKMVSSCIGRPLFGAFSGYYNAGGNIYQYGDLSCIGRPCCDSDQNYQTKSLCIVYFFGVYCCMREAFSFDFCALYHAAVRKCLYYDFCARTAFSTLYSDNFCGELFYPKKDLFVEFYAGKSHRAQ